MPTPRSPAPRRGLALRAAPPQDVLRLRERVMRHPRLQQVEQQAPLAFDCPDYWDALHALLSCCEPGSPSREHAAVTVHGAEDALLIAVGTHRADWRPGQAPPPPAADVAVMTRDPRFRKARERIERLGGGCIAVEDAFGLDASVVTHFPGAAASAPAQQRADLSGRRVLVVDDCRDLAEALCEYLHAMGAQAIPASEGERAIWLISRLRPDVVVLDLAMPAPDGFAIARWVRRRPALDAIKLIAVSGYADARNICRAAASGCDASLLKPPDLARLAAEIAAGTTARVPS